jgi:mono/diheme cytochrome c family protein
MPGPLRWLLNAVLAAAALTALGFFWVYLASESNLRAYRAPPAFALAIPADAASITRGEHLVATLGCRGCHGADLEGAPMWGYAIAPNLPALIRERGVVAFEAALRHGIGGDGRAMYSMPSFSFIRLRDADVAALAGYLAAAPVKRVELPEPALPWGIRLALARGNDKPIAGFLPLVPPLLHAREDSALARGEYIAMTTCIECHGFRLRGDELFGSNTPDLAVIAAYDEAAFNTLMRTGKALGDRELPMMSGVARGRFVHFTDQEVRDLFAFLKDKAARID